MEDQRTPKERLIALLMERLPDANEEQMLLLNWILSADIEEVRAWINGQKN